LRVPPLRERVDDVPLLAEEFLKAFAERHGRPGWTLTSEAADYLKTQEWPGNVRQLKHEIERAAIFTNDSRIGLAALRNPLETSRPMRLARISSPEGGESGAG